MKEISPYTKMTILMKLWGNSPNSMIDDVGVKEEPVQMMSYQQFTG